MSIRKHLEQNGTEYRRYVDYGRGLQGDCMKLATKALVFLILCFNEPWKLPIGYFLFQVQFIFISSSVNISEAGFNIIERSRNYCGQYFL